ncbi:MAG: helicase/secretion neighborhood TadE-like protein [Acidimicrobiia bacterium]|nr:helicase/secretion neighborhood TadE-like protein [Acidimicrobiia bacterium]
MDRDDQRGQVLPFLALVMVVAIAVAITVVRLGGQIDHRARAQTAADAVALAGAGGGEDAARIIATHNGAQIESFVFRDGEVEVVVRVADRRASARARRSW